MSEITSLSQLDLSYENYTYADYLSWKFEQAVELIKAVREYLIIDPEHENAFQFHLTEVEVYSPATIYVDDDVLTSVIFPDLQLNLKEVFSAS